MNFLKQLVATALLCLALQYFFPWWTLVIGAFAASYWAGNKAFMAFLAGFLGVALLWLVAALVIDLQTQSILTDKVAQLFPTKTPALLLLLTAIVGGLPAGFAGMTGAIASPRH
ncbi:MAG: hypothetical protein JNL40_04495 [Cyclobacteriaceae bacterium]|nr:hypothetical protein [Cyclobacteriaceae bacterium]